MTSFEDSTLYLEMEKNLNRYLSKSKSFCEKYCHPDWLSDLFALTVEKQVIKDDFFVSNKLKDDFDYFIFTKSTKTLHSIKALLRDKKYYFNEDILILTRSIFEGHLASRYFRERIEQNDLRQDAIQEFIRNPLGILTGHYSLEGGEVKTKSDVSISKLQGPSSYKIGKDKRYYHDFYSFLCRFTHNSFAVMDCYFDGAFYYYEKENLSIETLLFVLFTITKVFEGIATVTGENYDSLEEEKNYYDLVYDSLELQEEVIDHLISKYSEELIPEEKWAIQQYLGEGGPGRINGKMIKMLKNMKASLYEEIGSLKKIRGEDGRFIRRYPVWD